MYHSVCVEGPTFPSEQKSLRLTLVPVAPESNPMPQWTLNCKNCKKIFSHSKIESPQTVRCDTRWPYRPETPEGGLTIDCPHCQTSALYQRFQFTFSPE